jgi:hypothetical protein
VLLLGDAKISSRYRRPTKEKLKEQTSANQAPEALLQSTQETRPSHGLPCEDLLSEGLLSEGLLSEGLLSEDLLSEGLLSEGLLSEGLLGEGLLGEGLLGEGLLGEGLLGEGLLCEGDALGSLHMQGEIFQVRPLDLRGTCGAKSAAGFQRRPERFLW